MWYFLIGLAFYHHLQAREHVAEKLNRDATDPQWRIVLPGYDEGASSTMFFGTAMDLLVCTSRSTLADLAEEIVGVNRRTARELLDHLVVTSLPIAATPADKDVYSGLFALTPSKLLLVPVVALMMGDPDMLLKFALKYDRQTYERVISKWLGASGPKLFEAQLKPQANLAVAIERKLSVSGRLLTDIDLGVYDRKHNILVCFEFKSLWLQDAASLKSADDTLAQATARFSKIASYLRGDDGTRFRQIFNVEPPASNQLKVYNVLVTRRTYAMRQYEGIPVVTQIGLTNLLREARFDLLRFVEMLQQRDLQRLAHDGSIPISLTSEIDDLKWKATGFRSRDQL
jgi:hypothetical protein